MQTVSLFSNDHGQICEDYYNDGATLEYIIEDLMKSSFNWDYADLDEIIQIRRDGSFDYYPAW